MGLPLRDDAYHTYADYCRWPEGVRYELIDGAAHAMAPAPARVHQEILGELYFQARSAFEGSACRPYIAPFDVRLPKADEADEKIDTVVQPDLLVVCDPAKLDERGCRGAPDWVVGVLSPSTAGHDQILKLAVYERSGVPEVWLVHPTDRTATVYRLQAGAYGRPAIHELTGSLAVVNLPAIVIDWARVLQHQPQPDPEK
jgi:Uma2 family endonuclease